MMAADMRRRWESNESSRRHYRLPGETPTEWLRRKKLREWPRYTPQEPMPPWFNIAERLEGCFPGTLDEPVRRYARVAYRGASSRIGWDYGAELNGDYGPCRGGFTPIWCEVHI